MATKSDYLNGFLSNNTIQKIDQKGSTLET